MNLLNMLLEEVDETYAMIITTFSIVSVAIALLHRSYIIMKSK